MVARPHLDAALGAVVHLRVGAGGRLRLEGHGDGVRVGGGAAVTASDWH